MEYFDIETVITPEMKRAAKKSGEYKDLKNLIEMSKERIPKKIGERIVEEFFKCDGKYQLGIARTGNKNVEEAFTEGYYIRSDIDSNISFYTNHVIELPILLTAYTDANEWRGGCSNQLFVFKIPNESILKRCDGLGKPIIARDLGKGFNGYSGSRRVLPEYILGYFSVFDNEYIENPNYREEHTYEDYRNLEYANIVSDRISQHFAGDIKTKRPEEKTKQNIFQKLMEFLKKDRRQKKLSAPEFQKELIDEESSGFVKNQYRGSIDTERALNDAKTKSQKELQNPEIEDR